MANVRRYHPLVAEDLSTAAATMMRSRLILGTGFARPFVHGYAMLQIARNLLDASKAKCVSRFLTVSRMS